MGYLSISSLILFHSFHCIVSSRDPGVELIVTQNLADYINQNLPSILIPRLSSLSIPDLRNGDAELYSVHVEALNIGSSSIQFSSSGLTLCFSQMSFHGKARWKYEIGIIKFSGKVDIHLKDSNIVSTLVLAEKDRQPDVSLKDCRVEVNIELEFSDSSIAWVLNLFKGSIEWKVKRALEDTVCGELIRALSEGTSRVILDYPTTTPIGDVVYFDASLGGQPKFGENFLQLTFSGLCSDHIPAEQLNHQTPQSISSEILTDHMLYLRFRPHTFNTAILGYFFANSFDIEWDILDFSATFHKLIDIKCIFGFSLDQCSTQYNSRFTVRVYAPRAPIIHTLRGSVDVVGSVIVEVRFSSPLTTHPYTILRISVDGKLCGIIEATNKNDGIFVSIQPTCVTVFSTFVDLSIVGSFDFYKVSWLINELTDRLMPVVSQYLSRGIQIHQSAPGPYSVKNFLVNIESEYIKVGADLQFNSLELF